MKETFTHKCIKCGEQYSSDEPDPYYCIACNEQRLVIAKEVEAKLARKGPVEKTPSDLEMFDAIAKQKGGVRGGATFVNVKDLGIKL